MIEYRLGERVLAWYLSSITGFIDAIGFMYLGGFFLSFMSGNTTRLTASAAEGAWDITFKAAGLMGLFLTGVAMGSLIYRLGLRHLPHGRPREAVLLFVASSTILSGILVALDLGDQGMLFLSFAVGAMNSVFERDGQVAISLTYMTGTLVKTAQNFVGAFFGGDHRLWIHHFLLWASLAGGSILGGLSYVHWELRAVWVVAALVTGGVVVAIGNRERRRRLGLSI
ncbi:YoaK family protein [Corynebacterium sphenisci]|uniref:YoaK family protein n=1 Tax=Corynebacterium sphenisci TaxID=191493 RepID=UPI0026E03CBD|nr:YoaK family protein [Corynebacterium sphenisci]MDO5730668.1 YoaK family protein [Corynebacterium sphenisci]